MLGLLVLLRDKKAIVNLSFFLFVLAISGWAITNFTTDSVVSLSVSLWSARAANFFGILSVAFMGLFVGLYTNRRDLCRALTVLLFFVPGLIVSLSSYGVVAVTSVTTAANQELGTLYILVLVTLVGGVLLMIRDLAIGARLTNDMSLRSNYRLIMNGIIATFVLAMVTNILMPIALSTWSVSRLGPIFSLIMVATVAYGMAKHKLFDIKTALVRSLTYTFTLITLGLLYATITFGVVGNLLFGDTSLNSHQQITYTLLALLTAFIFQPIHRFFNRITNRFFYRDAYDPQQFLDELNKDIVSNIELGILLRRTTAIIQRNLKAEFVEVIVRKTDFAPQRLIGTRKTSYLNREIDYIAEKLQSLETEILIADDLPSNDRKLNATIEKHQIAFAVPLVITAHGRPEPIAYMFFGPKKSGNPYNKQDYRIIKIIADEMVIATENALRFEEIQGFNITLQKKVNDATAKLKRSNEKLKNIDETKDEFISMASHQLRTPLTSVKGYLSMVLDGDAGKLNKQQQQMLQQAFSSSQRMVYLIADMLNVSRLHTGKFIIEPRPTDISSVVGEEIKQLEEIAKAKKVKLIYKQPKTKPPKLMLDETKTRQVVMNLVDNALHYTPSGGMVTIQLVDKPLTVEFKVIDSGMGVPKSEQKHLFTKFYRATNARTARPDGTGLGLFMAKKVIVAQHGSIIFDSKPGKGSTFGFILSKSKLKTPESN